MVKYIGVRNAARRLGVHENTVRNWTDRGVLHPITLPGSGFRRYDLDEIEVVRGTPAALSRLLFQVRESLEMWADVVEIRSGQTDDWNRRLVERIDAYRLSRGWSPHGFGAEESGRGPWDDVLLVDPGGGEEP